MVNIAGLQGCGYWGQSADENTVCHPPLVTVTFGSGRPEHDESGQMRETGRLAAFPESKEADMADVREAKVPDIGDFDGVPVIEVMVKPGDHVDKDQGLVTLESAKATMEIPAPFAGTVKEMKVK